MPRTRDNDPPARSLTLFLLKTGTRKYEDALDEPSSLKRHGLKDCVPFKGAVFMAPQRKAPPGWMTFLQEGAEDELKALFNASTSAVLFIRGSKRIFAFTFGYGRSLLDPARIERSFGLRVVLNTVDEQSLNSVDSKTVQELTVQTRRQVSRASGLAEFGIDKEEDLLGFVRGAPRDSGFARSVAGADALQLSAPIKFEDLGKKCREILKAHRSHEYRKRGFEFVDHVRSVTDPDLIESLDGDLVDAILQRAIAKVHMAPPEIVDWQTTEGFSFAKAAEPVRDLDITSFFDQIRKPSEIDVARLKRQRILVHSTNAPEPTKRWPVYRTLVAEFDRKNERYILSGGEWFEIERSFAERIAKRVDKIELANLGLPAARSKEEEKDYNTRAAKGSGIYCVDRRCPRVAGDEIEFCDLYVSKNTLVHVKRWTRSSTLSHLFAQGKVSAEAFLSDPGFRAVARKLLKEQASSLANQIPVGPPNTSKYTIVFAIIKGGKKGWKRSLPFFSQLHLVRSAESLRNLGFDVRLERIDVHR